MEGNNELKGHFGGHRSKLGTYENSEFSALSVITGSPVIIDSNILGNSVVSDNAEITNSIVFNSIISNDARVNNAVLIGSEVTGSTIIVCPQKTIIKDCIIEEGCWSRSPISYTLPTGVTVTEGINDKVVVDCCNNRISKWLRAGRRFGRIKGYTEGEIDMIEYYINQIKVIKNV